MNFFHVDKWIIMLLGLFSVGVIIFCYKINQYDLTLLGDEVVNIYLNEPYKEVGYVAYDRNGVDVSDQVKVSGIVDITTLGTYKIKYQIGSVKLYRTINVVYNNQLDISFFLIGEEVQYILKDNDYISLGCKAVDAIEGDISSRIVTYDNVDTSTIGEYQVEYTVVNSRGTKKSIFRKVIVYDIEYDFKEEIINGKYVITLNFDSDFYQKIKLPDGSISIFKEVKYSFSENGNYILEVYDKYDNVKKIDISVTEVDVTAPTGTCIVNLYDNISNVIVEAFDNKEIKGYVYYYGNEVSDITKNDKFSYNSMVNDVEVMIYDTSNNSIKIKCIVNDLSTRYTRSYTTESNGYQYKLYIPETLTMRNKLPLVVFLHGKGECGGSVNRVDANSFPKYISEGMDYDFVMIAPHLTESNCNSLSSSKVKKIIDDVVANYPIDTHRIIVTGFSLGAINTYKMIKKYPTFFAGAIPVSYYTYYEDILLQTNIWSFVGTNDSNYDQTRRLMEKVIAGNPNSKFTVVNGSHNITERVYKNQEVINWIMKAYR